MRLPTIKGLFCSIQGVCQIKGHLPSPGFFKRPENFGMPEAGPHDLFVSSCHIAIMRYSPHSHLGCSLIRQLFLAGPSLECLYLGMDVIRNGRPVRSGQGLIHLDGRFGQFVLCPEDKYRFIFPDFGNSNLSILTRNGHAAPPSFWLVLCYSSVLSAPSKLQTMRSNSL